MKTSEQIMYLVKKQRKKVKSGGFLLCGPPRYDKLGPSRNIAVMKPNFAVCFSCGHHQKAYSLHVMAAAPSSGLSMQAERPDGGRHPAVMGRRVPDVSI